MLASIAVLGGLLAACVRPALAPAYRPRAGSDSSDARGERVLAEIAQLRRWPALHTVTLPSGVRELRIADDPPWVLGWPAPVLRLVAGPTGASGEVLLFWSEAATAPSEARGTRCGAARNGVRTCVSDAPRSEAVDWTRVAAHFDSLGAWTISAPCETTLHYSDAGTLHLERLAGEVAGEYVCNAPTVRRETAAGRAAAALYAYFYKVTAMAESPDR